MIINVDLEKAREIAHEKRRLARSIEFIPLDNIIMKQIPGTNFEEVEAERQSIREKYAILQNQMNQASTVSELKDLVPEIDPSNIS